MSADGYLDYQAFEGQWFRGSHQHGLVGTHVNAQGMRGCLVGEASPGPAHGDTSEGAVADGPGQAAAFLRCRRLKGPRDVSFEPSHRVHAIHRSQSGSDLDLPEPPKSSGIFGLLALTLIKSGILHESGEGGGRCVPLLDCLTPFPAVKGASGVPPGWPAATLDCQDPGVKKDS